MCVLHLLNPMCCMISNTWNETEIMKRTLTTYPSILMRRLFQFCSEFTFADASNLDHCIKYLNQSLVTFGFPGGLDLVSNNPVSFPFSLHVHLWKSSEQSWSRFAYISLFFHYVRHENEVNKCWVWISYVLFSLM